MRFRIPAALIALFAASLPLAAAAQEMDGPGQDAEAAQFENESPRPSVVGQLRGERSQQSYTRQPVRDDNVAEQSDAALQAHIEVLRRRIDNANRLLEAAARGNYIVAQGKLALVLTPAEVDSHMAAGTLIDGSDAFDPLETMERSQTGMRTARESMARETRNSVAALQVDRRRWFALRDQILRELDNRRREAMAEADRPGSAYDPNAGADDGPSFAWDTRTRIYGVECFGGQHLEVYTDHYSLNGQYVGVDRREYDRIRGQGVASGRPFCGAWETRRETTAR